MTTSKRYLLWGYRIDYKGTDKRPYILKVGSGSHREVKAEQRRREREGVWNLAVYGLGTDPMKQGLGAQFLQDFPEEEK